jgi:iron(III) transport system permease protein
MNLGRMIGKFWGFGLLVLALAPVLALPLATLLERNPGGAIRASALPILLMLSDDFAWECLRNSVVASAFVTTCSFLVGIGLAAILGRARFLGSGALCLLVLSPMAILPICSALGLRAWVDVMSRGSPSAPSGSGLSGWLAFVWVGTAVGAAWVAQTSLDALGRVKPVWNDFARSHSASGWRLWCDLDWPTIRSESAQAAGQVFSLALFEPGIPLIFGLRRTLAFQIVETATGPNDALPQSALLVLLGVLVAGCVRGALRWRRMFGRVAPPRVGQARIARMAWPRSSLYALLLGVWGLFAWTPALGLLLSSAAPAGGPSNADTLEPTWAVRGLFDDPECREVLIHSLAIGLASAVLAIVLCLALGKRRGLIQRLAAFPPLAIGVGALAIPWFFMSLSDGFLFRGSRALHLGWAPELARGLDPYSSPGTLLVWALAASFLPSLARAMDLCRAQARPVLLDAAFSSGASRRQVRWSVLWPLAYRPLVRPWLMSLALAATALTPGVLLTPTSSVRPLGPALLVFSSDPGGSRRAQGLAAIAVILNLSTWLLVSRRPNGKARPKPAQVSQPAIS